MSQIADKEEKSSSLRPAAQGWALRAAECSVWEEGGLSS